MNYDTKLAVSLREAAAMLSLSSRSIQNYIAARGLFGEDFSEKRVSDEVNFSLDFYIPDEATAVEIALGLHNPLTEFERDIFKCLLARDAGCKIDRLLLVAKPGGSSRLAAPGPRAIADFVKKNFSIQVEIRELVPP